MVLAACATAPTADRRLATLESELRAANSATAVLQARCPTAIAARRVAGADKLADQGVRGALGAAAGETIRYRRVRLMCGETVYSEADNWYLPARLTPEINRTLETTETPFGVAVRPLNYTRRTLESHRRADPDWPLELRAVLAGADGRPFSLVVETYSAVLTARPPLTGAASGRP